MRPWSQATVQDYLRLTLRAHSLLHDVPIHDVWRVALPDGGPARTMKDVRSVFKVARQSQRLSLSVRALFGLRPVKRARMSASEKTGRTKPRACPVRVTFPSALADTTS